MNREAAGENRLCFFHTSTLRVIRRGSSGMNRRHGSLRMASAPSMQNAQPSPLATSRAALESSVQNSGMRSSPSPRPSQCRISARMFSHSGRISGQTE